MIWWIGPVATGIAAWRLFADERAGLAWIAVIVGVVGFWTAGIAANYARGQEAEIPDAAAFANIVATLGGVALLVVSFVV